MPCTIAAPHHAIQSPLTDAIASYPRDIIMIKDHFPEANHPHSLTRVNALDFLLVTWFTLASSCDHAYAHIDCVRMLLMTTKTRGNHYHALNQDSSSL
jgi:hypothetical protein